MNLKARNSRFNHSPPSRTVSSVLAVLGLAITSANAISPTGTIFRDFDANSVKDTGEPGIVGATVKAYDAAGDEVASVTTDASGNYYLPSSSGPVRVEVSGFPSYLSAGASGTAKPLVFTAASGAISQNVALQNPSDYSDADADIATPCYVNGDPTVSGSTAAPLPWMVRIPYSPAATTGLNTYMATGETIGATWGLAYKKTTRTLFSAAVLKRHSGLGIGGISAIYKTTENAGSFTNTLFLKLSDYGIDVGANPRVSGDISGTAANPNHDANIFDAAGKRGLGDIDISEDEKTLWVINLNTRSLVEIPIGNDGVAPPLTGAVVEHNLPTSVTPAVSKGTLRPWGIGVKDGSVYVGAVGTAEASGGTAADLRGYIFKHDPAGAVGNFTQIADFALNYPRGYETFESATSKVDAEWRPWISSWSSITGPAPGAGPYTQTMYPQPILTDIDFDTDGSLILGFADRFGFQSGNRNYSPTATDTAVYEGVCAGDVLRLFKTSTGYALESNGTAPAGSVNAGSATGGANTSPGQGPGNGEWYWQEMYSVTSDKNGGGHQEISLGGLASRYGSGKVAVTAFDALYDYRAGGVQWLSHSTGMRTDSYQIFGLDEGGQPVTFGKSAGLGDLEIMSGTAPLQIGDLIWNDANHNGRQDPGEAGIASVALELWEDTDGNGAVDTKVGNTTSDGSGGYLFGGKSDSGMLSCGLGPVHMAASQIKSSADDAEQSGTTVTLNSAALDIPRVGTTAQTVGMRFCGLNIPKSAIIESARLTFTANAADSTTPVNVVIKAQDADTVAAFTTGNNDITNRATTASSVNWTIPAWTRAGESAAPQKSPDISSLVQQLVNRTGWTSSSCLTVIMSNGTGTGSSATRRAYSADNTTQQGPILAVTYRADEKCRIVAGRKYEVRVASGQTALGTLSPTTPAADAAQRDSNGTVAGANVVTSITPNLGQNDHTLDFGFYEAPLKGAIGNLVFCDYNDDGIRQVNGIDGIPGNADDEVGIEGVVLTLHYATGGTVDDPNLPGTQDYTVTSGADGSYHFINLDAGDYQILATPIPSKSQGSHIIAIDDNGVDNDNNGAKYSNNSFSYTVGIHIDAGETDDTIDFGFLAEPKSTIGNTVFCDYNNDGIQQPLGADGLADTQDDEPGIEGVVLTLCDIQDVAVDNPNVTGTQDYTTTTDADGHYSFTGLTNAYYSVKILTPPTAKPLPSSTYSSAEGIDDNNNGYRLGFDSPAIVSATFYVGLGKTNNTIDFGLIPPPAKANVGNLVFCDYNNDGIRQPLGTDGLAGTADDEPGIEGVTLSLYDTNEQPVDNPNIDGIQSYTVTTDSNGAYSFINLNADYYQIRILTPPSAKPNSSTATKSIGNGIDNDDNGLQGTQGGVISTPYFLLRAGETNDTVDFGLVAPPKANLGNLVFCDYNNDGHRDPNGTDGIPGNADDEPGIEGVVLTLCDEQGTPVDNPNLTGTQDYTATTGSNGAYAFLNLDPGTYTVKIATPPDGKPNSSISSETGIDNFNNGQQSIPGGSVTSYPIVLSSGETDDTVDFGFVPLPKSSLGNIVFCDVNNDGFHEFLGADDLPETGDEERGIPGVVLTLCYAQGTPVDNPNIEGTQPYTTSSDKDGFYLFTGLDAGNYIVKILTPPSDKPNSSTVTDTSDNQVDKNDNGTQPTPGGAISSPVITLSVGETDDTVDFGLIPAMAIGNLVFIDLNGNHTYDSYGDLVMEGITLSVYPDADGDGTADSKVPAGTATTNAAGCYLVDGLLPGKYIVVVDAANFQAGGKLQDLISVQGAGNDDGTDDDSDENGLDLGNEATQGVKSRTITLALGTEPNESGKAADSDDLRESNVDLTIDFGVKGQRVVSGQVRFDSDQDGNLETIGDTPLADFTIQLWYDVNGNGIIEAEDSMVGQQSTGADGKFKFPCLPNGNFLIIETPPNGTIRNTATTDGIDRKIALTVENEDIVNRDFLETVDPQGWFYDVETCQIILGGSVEVTSMPVGGDVTYIKQGVDGEYAWLTNGVDGTYSMAIHVPAGYELAPQAAYQPLTGPLNVPIGTGNYILGSVSSSNGTALADCTAAANPWYLSFTLNPGAQAVLHNNIPLQRLKPISWTGWQSINSLGGLNSPADNPDGDIYDNLQEFAFCYPPSTGINNHCPLEVVQNGGSMDAHVTTLTDAIGLTYTLEYISDLSLSSANGGGWTPVTTITPSSSANPDGTTTLVYSNLASIPALTNSQGFVRVKVDLASPAITTRTYAAGWIKKTINQACETYSNPFLPCEIFSGTVDGNTAIALNVNTSAGTNPFSSALVSGKTYSVEVTGGPLAGHHWLVDSTNSSAATISLGAGTSTLAANSLAGSSVIVRELQTIASQFPTSQYLAGSTPNDSDKVLMYDPASPNKWTIYFLIDGTALNLGVHWVKQGDNTLTNKDDTIINHCEGIFIHHRGTAIQTTLVGHVRQNQIVCPLQAGQNLLASVYPIDQNYTERAMTWNGGDFQGFAGALDPVRADNVLFWKGDTTLGLENYTTYWLVDAKFNPYRRWTLQGDNTLSSQDGSKVFKATRSAFIRSLGGHSTYTIPTGWVP